MNKRLLKIDENNYKKEGEIIMIRKTWESKFGYLANTPATSQVLSGTYNYPPGCDPATQELLQ